MKRLVIATLFVLASGLSHAADQYKGPVYGPQIRGGYDWSGVWVGIQGAYAFEGQLNNPFTSFPTDGYSFGGNIGAQRQLGNWVIGIELEGNWSKIEGNSFAGPVAVNHNTEAYGSLRARLGYALDRLHVYGLVGPSLASTEATLSVPGFSTSATNLHWGYVVGAGVDWAVAPNWIVSAEWNWYQFGSEAYGFPIGGPIGLVTPADFDFHVGKIKAAYKY